MGRIWDLIVSVPDHCLSFYSFYKKILMPLMMSIKNISIVRISWAKYNINNITFLELKRRHLYINKQKHFFFFFFFFVLNNMSLPKNVWRKTLKWSPKAPVSQKKKRKRPSTVILQYKNKWQVQFSLNVYVTITGMCLWCHARAVWRHLYFNNQTLTQLTHFRWSDYKICN